VIVARDPLSGLLGLAPSPTVRGLTPLQKLAMRGPQRFRAWMAGRRAGKSYAAAVWLLGGKAGQISAYCARTLKSAKAIMLGVFAELNARYRLNLDIRSSTGTITEPNGHIIQFYGLNDVSQADLMRGQKFRRVFIDEGGAFHDSLIKYCVESVIQPALVDLRGELTLAGTPGPIPKGYFYDVTGNPGLEQPIPGRWPTWHWTYLDNPHVPGDLVLEEALRVNGWTPEHATFKREYGGIWCEDADALIYRYKGEQWARVPGPGVTGMALDFGVVDRTTWTVGRQPFESRPHLWIVETIAKSNCDLPEIATITKQLRAKWSVNIIRADEGALGKGYANNLRQQYRIPIEAVPKPGKRAKIDGVVGRLVSETLHLCEAASGLYDEWLSLCWNETRTDHHERQDDDLSDGCCYLADFPEFSAWEHPPTKHEEVTLQSALKERAMLKANRGSGFGSI
jgi:hypothetical protein